MRIKEFKELAKDCLCMMAVIPAGVTTALVQLIGRKDEEIYNPVAYVAGAVLFLAYLVLAVRYITSEKKYPPHRDSGILYWVIFFAVALLSSYWALLGLAFTLFSLCSFWGMSPTLAYNFTLVGIPITNAVVMVIAGILCVQSRADRVKKAA
ncbi:hypothetical protein [uncultured Ruminococcus sp.]|uniref:hypothetical protein n=1 Tax=uncultured Ruminococcus sp. TaxID=165186 RepID=UPI000EE7BE31|nr:hypothetical protein [uncultured Ruminococcus sp.]HCJ40223.1 hypothetical protein [Ruminococcus sp.]